MPKLDRQRLVARLAGYRAEGEDARDAGWGQRGDVWRDNCDLYFSRFDFSKKAEWQSKQAMPEASLYIDRWAAALRATLIVPNWFTIETHIEELEPAFKKFLGYWLERCGTTATGYHTSFDRVFEDQAKLAALMAASASVTWEEAPGGGGRVRVDTVDPREVILDPTLRGMYRIRRREMDYHQLLAEARSQPDLYDMDEIERLSASRSAEMETERQELVGHDVRISSDRKPVVVDEYLCTILDDNGDDAYGEKQLCVVANETHLIRGPEANPFMHGRDWIVFSPAISVPLSVYGKTYVETWGGLAKLFTEMTNIVIDAGMLAGMNAFAIDADMLEDPEQATDGVYPNKTFVLKAGADAKRFVETLQLGNLSTAAVDVWTALKQEMREGAATNDLDLGQSVPKGDVTATEINAVQAGGTALIQSIATSLETGGIDPILNLVFQTALQHAFVDVQPDGAGGFVMPPAVEPLRLALGDTYFNMLASRWQDFLRLAPVFRARGISGQIDRGQKLQAIMGVFKAVGSSPLIQQALMQSVSFGKLAKRMLVLMGIDPEEFKPDPTEMMPLQAPTGSPSTRPLPPPADANA